MSGAIFDERDLQNEDAIICICESEIDDNGTIQCDNCGRWQHMRCVGIDPGNVDLDELVYHCDQCQPRPLDREAAKSYIQRYQLEEAQSLQPKSRRGRGKGHGRRTAGSATSPNSRQESRRARGHKSLDLEDLKVISDKANPPTDTTQSTSHDTCTVTEDASVWMAEHKEVIKRTVNEHDTQALAISVRELHDTQALVRGVFSEQDAVSGTFIGRFAGVVHTKQAYMADSSNQFETLRGPAKHVVFVEQCELVVDSRQSGTDLRYVRKSCSPNCLLYAVSIEPQTSKLEPSHWRFELMLKCDIKRGEEFTIGYQWSVEDPNQLPGMDSAIKLEQFALHNLKILGECACCKRPALCHILRCIHSPPSASPPISRKHSNTGEVAEVLVDTSMSGKNASSMNPSDAPMNREERKIQMAIARMENADLPKVKRRRRNTGDESNLQNGRRSTSLKIDEANAALEELRRSLSPDPQSPNSSRSSQLKIRPQGSLIRPASPNYEESQHAPRKVLWLRTFATERAIKEEQRLRLAEQAKEATARLAEEATKKKLELELQARALRDAKEKEEELRRKEAEREAMEALQRAREREIWGDHSAAATSEARPPLANHAEPERPVDALQSTSGGVQPDIRPQLKRDTSTATAMGPPSMPRDSSLASPQATPVIPKIVRKLSVSEYWRQRKERQASEASPSPTTDGFGSAHARNSIVETSGPDDDKSEGEIEPEDLEMKKEPRQAGYNEQSSRNDYFQTSSPALQSPVVHHQQHHQQQQNYNGPTGPMIHPSRQFPLNAIHHPNPPNQSPTNARHIPSSDPRSHRPQNTNGNNGSYGTPNSGSYHTSQRPSNIPTGPKNG